MLLIPDAVNEFGSAHAGTFSTRTSSINILLPKADVAFNEIYPVEAGFPGIKKVYPFHADTASNLLMVPINVPFVEPATVL